ncbi:MAG TPA: hypothetical protein VEL77_14975 [Rugosimonospora sp.]|nr:hypothetical protein [Rugosimonospora sp.]
MDITESAWPRAPSGTTRPCIARGRADTYIERTGQWQGSANYAAWIGKRAAVAWLLANNRELPEDLAELEAEISE